MPTTLHAWFSAQTALRDGSAIFRKPGGSMVNVTRLDADLKSKGSYYLDEIYMGEVLSREDSGCARETQRLRGITD